MTPAEERRTGAAKTIGAVMGQLSILDTSAYGPEHSVAVSLAYSDLSGTLSDWLIAIVEGGDLPWSLYS